MRNIARQRLLKIFRAGLAAADPRKAVRQNVRRQGQTLRIRNKTWNLNSINKIFVIGAGKASGRMAAALKEVIGDRITWGWINVKSERGCGRLEEIHLHEAGHPVPDAAGLSGAKEIAEIARSAGKRDLVIVCISGGGSALLPLPVEGVSLRDKKKLTDLLLASGADISEINTVRKHISQLKGGRLAELAQPAQVVSLILSDVIGDPLDTIASGPTAPDSTTFSAAMAVLRRHGIEEKCPASILNYLRAGAHGDEPETPKANNPLFARVHNFIIANNSASLAACAAQARKLGYKPLILSSTVSGEARDIALMHVAVARECLARKTPVAPPACLISGGETTVTLTDAKIGAPGLGGRNQEFALAAAIAARGLDEISILAGGTDGTDGPTDADGAFADGQTLARAGEKDLDARDFLARHDAYHFFERLNDLLITGPTGTNVMDLYLLLIEKSPR